MIDVNEYQKLKAKVDQARTDADKAAGAKERIQAEMKKEFDCDSQADAVKMLKKLEQEEKTATKKYEDAFVEFESEWAEYLEVKGESLEEMPSQTDWGRRPLY